MAIKDTKITIVEQNRNEIQYKIFNEVSCLLDEYWIKMRWRDFEFEYLDKWWLDDKDQDIELYKS